MRGSRDEPLPSASELVEQRHHLSSSGAAQRVTQSDGSSVRIHLLQRDAQLLHTVHGLSSSRGSVQPVTEQEEKTFLFEAKSQIYMVSENQPVLMFVSDI